MMKVSSSRRLGRFVKWTLIVIVLLVYAIGISAWQIWTFAHSAPGNADAAIVLGASTWNGKPSPIFEERIRHGIDLYKSGRVKKLLFSGGVGEGEPVSLAEAGKKVAIAQGVKESDILIEPWSRKTVENLVYSKEVAEEHGLDAFLIVSDPLHMKRAMTVAKGKGLDALPSSTPTTRFRSVEVRRKFLRREIKWYLWYVMVGRFVSVREVGE